MDQLTATARKIDIVFKILDIMLKIAFVACLVCTGIVLVGAALDLPGEMLGYVDGQLQLGALTLHIADTHLPSFDTCLTEAALMMVIGAVISFIAILCVRTIRSILAPMKDGQPFHTDISKHLRKLGWLSLLVCIGAQVMEAVSLFLIAAMHRIDQLLLSDKITKVEIVPSFDLGVLIIPAVFFLLAYIFKYGAELQQLSDETL